MSDAQKKQDSKPFQPILVKNV